MNCQGECAPAVRIMPAPTVTSPTESSTRAPKRSTRLPAIGDMIAMTTAEIA
jgi:hypothetical protein